MAAVALLAPAAPQLPGLVQQKSEKLWSEALSSLKSDLRESLLSVEGDRRATLEVVLFEARNKREIAMRKQWKITKKNGDIIILRDVFEKIIQWVDKFKAIGDTAMSAAPSYASIPWNVVCVLIKVTINESEEFAAMIDGLQEVTNVIARYAIFESIYLQQHTSATEHLEASLVALYAAVLSFLGEADAHFGRNTTRRFLRSTLRPASEIEKSLELIRSRQTEVDRTANIAGMEILQNTSTAMHELVTMVGNLTLQLNITNYRLEQMHTSRVSRPKSPTESLKSVVTSIMGPTQRLSQRGPMPRDDLSPEARRIIFDWLSPVKYQTHHLVETKDRLPNSGAWMFRSSQFRNWRDSSISETLWLHGMPGCGKTKLASAVIDLDLGVGNAHTSNAAPLAYFYCSRNSAEPERWDPSEVLRCIARQLCRDDPDFFVYEPLKHLYEKADKPRHGERRIDNDACVELVLQLLRENPATIVIDALDELDPDRRHSLLESLDQIVKRSANVIKVFMTSRDDLDISIRLRSTPNLYISASSNQIDVASFIDVKIHEAVDQKKLLGGNVPPGLILKMKETLNDGAGGRSV
ncbi:hypothetical protein PFICI_03618 [Pestalotiopsis fici W106-1]|uniref:NACHT domain-containing protein n=1 Tax=Pestalotiopsis fici (strain W106-1 / CGMCC3.15140) TaxID=1229662 RepID=W3XHN4_PESFW|nr:uncharacterized protein PFICI_03618 [Pestalotiopsis fici W106-1]ETS85593.1 hypothetical protein PFICI_03618 [Pestalotiopsis fici W106-1]